MTHPHLEGLIPELPPLPKAAACIRKEALNYPDGKDEYLVWDAELADEKDALIYTADQMREYARAALAALPGGGVDEIAVHIPFGDDFSFSDLPAAKVMPDGEIRRTLNGLPMTPGTLLWFKPSPTPNPHEADRNG